MSKKCPKCKAEMKFLYESNDKVYEVWECPRCGKRKCYKGTEKCEPLVKEHKPEPVYPDYEIVQNAKGES